MGTGFDSSKFVPKFETSQELFDYAKDRVKQYELEALGKEIHEAYEKAVIKADDHDVIPQKRKEKIVSSGNGITIKSIEVSQAELDALNVGNAKIPSLNEKKNQKTFKRISRSDLPNLADEVKDLIQNGVYSLYTYSYNTSQYVLTTSDKIIYFLSPDGFVYHSFDRSAIKYDDCESFKDLIDQCVLLVDDKQSEFKRLEQGQAQLGQFKRYLSCLNGDQQTPKTKIRFEFKLQDFWIGLFWKKLENQTDIWICLIPCFPIHITRFRSINE